MGASVHPTLGFLHPKAKVCDSVTRPATNSVVVPREADGVPRQDGRGHPPLLDLQMAAPKAVSMVSSLVCGTRIEVVRGQGSL